MAKIASMLKDLKKALKERDIGEKKKLATFLEEPEKPTFLAKPALRVAEHFDLQADLLIWSKRLGSLGIVHLLGGGGEVEPRVRRHIDQAAYMRHLILSDKGLNNHQAATVELVLVAPYRGDTLSEIGRSLARIAAETSFLHAVGINILPHRSGKEPFTKIDLRRALCWLLQEVEAWYRCPFAQPTGGYGEHHRLASLELESYRLSGKCIFEFHDAEGLRLHLLHGRNGCGKSTIVEALELAWTGKVERLGNLPRSEYDSVVRYRGPQETPKSPTAPARITLNYCDADAEPVVILSNAIGDPKAGALQATSFRLDQTVMDRLTRLGENSLSNTFLQAFFPEERALFEKYEEARETARRWFDKLPDRMRTAFEREDEDGRCEALLEHFAWLHSSRIPSDEQIEDCLPISRAALSTLEPLTHRPLAALRTSPKKLPQVLASIDRSLADLRPVCRTHLKALHLARAALDELGDWEPQSGRATTDDFPELLNRWLELLALTNLAERHEGIVRSLAGAESQGWQLAWKTPVGLFARRPTASEEATLGARAREWVDERDHSFQDVMAAFAKRTGLPTSEESARGRFPTSAEIAAFDTIGSWILGDDEAADSLGKAIDQAARARQNLTAGDLVIGRQAGKDHPGWRQELGDRLMRFIAAFEELERLDEIVGIQSAADRYGLFLEAYEKHRVFAEKGKEIKKTFLRKIAPVDGANHAQDSVLNEALNELMALFTPARWAYDDISITYQADPEGQQQVMVRTRNDGASPMLRFNTAELNTFTVALFLLCAVRVAHPHRLLILDDPLQNMDEMTVTTLARGLAKLVRLLPEGWELLLLFHGEDDLERFRREVPAAVYSLGWLSPAEGPQDVPPLRWDPERSRLSAEIRNIASLLKDGP